MSLCAVNTKFYFLVAVYRYYDSRRKLYNDSQPARVEAAKENKKRTRKFQEQKRVSVYGLCTSKQYRIFPLHIIICSYLNVVKSKLSQVRWCTGKY